MDSVGWNVETEKRKVTFGNRSGQLIAATTSSTTRLLVILHGIPNRDPTLPPYGDQRWPGPCGSEQWSSPDRTSKAGRAGLAQFGDSIPF